MDVYISVSNLAVSFHADIPTSVVVGYIMPMPGQSEPTVYGGRSLPLVLLSIIHGRQCQVALPRILELVLWTEKLW